MKPSCNGIAKSQSKTTPAKKKSIPKEAPATPSLAHTEEYFRTLIENASDLITILDGDGLIRYESPSLPRVLGFAPEERIGKSSFELVHPDDLLSAVACFTEGMQHPGTIQLLECRFRHKNGAWRVLGNTGVNLLNDPVVRGIVVNSRDITDRRQTEDALRQSEQRFRELVENANDVIYTHDVEGNFTSLNPSGERITGYTREEALRMNLANVVTPEYLEQTRKMIALKIAENIPTIHTLEIISKSGNRVALEVSTRLLYRENKLVGIQGIARDITERTRVEQLLHQSEERYRIVAEAASDMLVTIDESSTILFANPAAEKIFGYAPDELIGKSLTILMPSYWRHLHRTGISSYVKTGQRNISWNDVEVQGLHKNGSEIPLEISFGEVTKDGKRLFIGVLREVAERKRVQEALKRSENKYRTLMEEASDGIHTYDMNGNILEVNTELGDMLGYTREELLQLNIRDLIPPADLARFPLRFDELRSGKVLLTERRLLRKDGTLLPVEVSGKMLPDGMLLGIVRNVSERKRTEEELRQSRRQLRALSSHLQSAREDERT